MEREIKETNIKKEVLEFRSTHIIITTIFAILALASVFVIVNSVFELVANGSQSEVVNVKVNGRAVDFPDAKPFIADNRTHVPTRFIAEHLGAKVEWENNSRTVTILKDPDLMTKRIIKYTIGERRIYVNNGEKSIDTGTFIESNRSYAPVRIVAETLGAIVKWEEDTKTVLINTVLGEGIDGEEDGLVEGDIIGDNYKVIDDRLYVYGHAKKEYIDVAEYSTLYTPKDLADMARYIHNAIEGSEKYIVTGFNGEEKGDISFSIYANKDQYFGDRINRASLVIRLLTNGNSEYVKNSGRYIDVGFTNITDQVNYVPKSDVDEYLLIVEDLMKIILKEKYSKSYYSILDEYAVKKSKDISAEDLFKGKVEEMYMRIYNSPHQYKTRLYLTEKELK